MKVKNIFNNLPLFNIVKAIIVITIVILLVITFPSFLKLIFNFLLYIFENPYEFLKATVFVGVSVFIVHIFNNKL